MLDYKSITVKLHELKNLLSVSQYTGKYLATHYPSLYSWNDIQQIDFWISCFGGSEPNVYVSSAVIQVMKHCNELYLDLITYNAINQP